MVSIVPSDGWVIVLVVQIVVTLYVFYLCYKDDKVQYEIHSLREDCYRVHDECQIITAAYRSFIDSSQEGRAKDTDRRNKLLMLMIKQLQFARSSNCTPEEKVVFSRFYDEFKEILDS